MLLHILFTTRMIPGEYTDDREGVLAEAGGEQHNITKAEPNDVKLGEGE